MFLSKEFSKAKLPKIIISNKTYNKLITKNFLSADHSWKY